jgi:hypothetical protein
MKAQPAEQHRTTHLRIHIHAQGLRETHLCCLKQPHLLARLRPPLGL